MSDKIVIAIMLTVVFSAVMVSGCIGQSVSDNSPGVFTSTEQIKTYLKDNAGSSNYGYYGMGFQSGMRSDVMLSAAPTSTSMESSGMSKASDYSTTNIQVAGVDEADFVKNDGKYIYMKTENNTVAIVDAFPAAGMKIVSEISFDENSSDDKFYLSQLYIDGDVLVVIGSISGYRTDYLAGCVDGSDVAGCVIPPRTYYSSTAVKVYDVTDRTAPILKKSMILDGNYYNSRMIGDYVYIISNDYIRSYGDDLELPAAAYRCGGTDDRCGSIQVYHFDRSDSSYQFTVLTGIDVTGDVVQTDSKVFMTGYSQNMFVSQDNVYMVYGKTVGISDYVDVIVRDVVVPSLPSDYGLKVQDVMRSNMTNNQKMSEVGKILNNYTTSLDTEARYTFQKDFEERGNRIMVELAKEMEKTVVHRLSVKDGKIDYKTNGEVVGKVLNQFSMDEFNSHFRIATTTGSTWDNTSQNHVFVLNNDLKQVGSVEDLAQGERIYSVRFLGNRGYVVTFRQTDPLFVLDLSNPAKPVVAGELKIPGYSSYLHPYDENHVIGIGQEANEQGRTQGLKLSMFDVTDPANPLEISKYVGPSYSHSDVEYDHKALLFSKEKSLLVVPVSYYVPSNGTAYGHTWYGSYVFNVNSVNGFQMKANLSHIDYNGTVDDTTKPYYYYWDYSKRISRSLFMDNTLYTVSDTMIKAHDLNTMLDISSVELPGGYDYRGPIYTTGLIE
ncbi:MAG: beta-propeller domain-containing protein [Candidatus Aenigmatarchaeota archaeon]